MRKAKLHDNWPTDLECRVAGMGFAEDDDQCKAVGLSGMRCAYDFAHAGPHYFARTLRGSRGEIGPRPASKGGRK